MTILLYCGLILSKKHIYICPTKRILVYSKKDEDYVNKRDIILFPKKSDFHIVPS